MQITKLAIKRSITFFMILLVFVGFGLFSLGRLKIDLFPSIDFPVIMVVTQYTGVGPFDIETVVTRPLEESIASVQNIKAVHSYSRQGLSLLLLEFEWGADMDQAETDVRNNLDFIEAYLPDDLTKPLVFALDPSMQPILFISLGSDVHGLAELRRISEMELEPRLERVLGVAAAYTIGGLQREIRVLLDPVRMKAHNISIPMVEAALQMNNLQMPSGWIEDREREFTIQTLGEYSSIEQIENTNIMSIAGSVIRIKDVADVVDGFVEQRSQVWTNDKPAVILVVQKQSDANTVGVTKEIKNQLPGIMNELPRGVEMEIIYDQADFINQSMSNLGNTAIQAILLAFLVLLFFMRNIRTSLIVALSIPISMVVTFAVMDQAGLTLNIISMAGLALAVGMLVDNSIVVMESIFRHKEMGKEAVEAAEIGAKEVSMAITASTLTTIAVFVPVLFVPGLAGELFNDMVVTICFSLIVSLSVALTLVPVLASRVLKVNTAVDNRTLFKRIAIVVGSWVDSLKAFYVKSLKWALYHKKTVILTTVGLFILSAAILATRGGEFIPESDQGFVQMTIERSPGVSLSSMEETVHKLNAIIREHVPESELVYTNFGQGEGMMAAFSASASNQGETMVKLTSRSKRDRSLEDIQQDLRDRYQAVPDVDVSFEDPSAQMFSGGGDINIQIFGHDLQIAEALANEIEGKIKNVRGVANTEISVKESAPELKINLDRQRIADLGLSTAQIGQIVSTSILGNVVTQYREGGNEYNIRVQLKKEARQNKSDIENILIMTPAGRQIPLRAIATVDYGTAPLEIVREDQERMVSVTVDISGRDLRTTTSEVRQILDTISVPSEMRIDIGGAAEEMMESFLYLGIAFGVAMVLTYMVMASQFESFLDPFIILFTIPLSIIGVALALFLTGTTVNVMSLIGIILLVGVIVNNGIVLVDYTNQLREQGKKMSDAILLAGEARMRPVLMTALTTILAMVPLALGIGESGELWAPMARSVIGGLTVGTVLTLVVVPVIYAIMETLSAKLKLKRKSRSERRSKKRLAKA